jgi:Bacterial extracellular solute-binding proteins, family 3
MKNVAWRGWAVAVSATLVHATAFANEVITYPAPETSTDQRSVYALQLLQLAIDESGVPYRLASSQQPTRQNRAFREVAKGKDLRIAWAMTSTEREADPGLRPIRIPISKGLIGWRLPLVQKDRAETIGQIREAAQLRHLTAGQGLDWPDLPILKVNQLPVVGVSSYPQMFTMVAKGRFDYFPRSVIEIDDELKTNEALGLAVAPGWVLHYKTADYFFVNRQDTKLAADLTRGLEKALANGRFDKLFQKHYGPAIARYQLGQRRVIELDNPLLPKNTPLNRPELWFQPQP